MAKRQIISEQIDEMLAQNIIRPSSSPWCSPITLVPKSSGEYRFCVNYRKLNSVTVKDSFPLPLIQDIFDQLQGARVFTCLNLKAAYNQISVSEQDIPKTAFICHRGLFEYLRMPFGLCNAPAVFQRTIESVLHGLIGTACFVYLDDVVVFGYNEEEHLRNLELVLEQFREFNLTVNPSKCKFAQSKVLLLGYTISEHGISENPDKIRAIVNLPIPTKVSEIRTFLGMSGYYHQLVPDYARISHPLIQLIKKGVQWQWTKDCQNSFDKLKEILTSDIVLAYPQTDRPYKLYTDASNYAVGAILVQEDDSGIERVIHYL